MLDDMGLSDARLRWAEAKEVSSGHVEIALGPFERADLKGVPRLSSLWSAPTRMPPLTYRPPTGASRRSHTSSGAFDRPA